MYYVIRNCQFGNNVPIMYHTKIKRQFKLTKLCYLGGLFLYFLKSNLLGAVNIWTINLTRQRDLE